MEDLRDEIINKIAALAMEAMLFEVSATPKPGLVDRSNCGAHKDMDYFTFMSSAAALHDSFDKMVRIGWEHRDEDLSQILQPLRNTGIEAEKKMFQFTKNVNTHKGMIFTLGILAGCAGWAINKMPLTYENLSRLSSKLCAGMCEKEYSNLDKKEHLTKGERMYLAYGITGARGEVEHGYKTVGNCSLPVYRKLRDEGVDVNSALVQTLLNLVAYTCDTNIISRHDEQTASFARDCAKQVLKKGGMFTKEGRKAIENMDKVFIEQYISPGGCADLLAVTHFIYSMETTEFIKYNVHIKGGILYDNADYSFGGTDFCHSAGVC